MHAGWWANGSIGDSEYVSAMQYLVGAGIINTSQQSASIVSDDAGSTPATTYPTNADISKCYSMTSAADKETCLDDIHLAQELKLKIDSATPYVVGPVTYYLVGADTINTGDREFINVHTVIENTGSESKNVDLYCFGPVACNYYLNDGEGAILQCSIDVWASRDSSSQTRNHGMEFL